MQNKSLSSPAVTLIIWEAAHLPNSIKVRSVLAENPGSQGNFAIWHEELIMYLSISLVPLFLCLLLSISLFLCFSVCLALSLFFSVYVCLSFCLSLTHTKGKLENQCDGATCLNIQVRRWQLFYLGAKRPLQINLSVGPRLSCPLSAAYGSFMIKRSLKEK